MSEEDLPDFHKISFSPCQPIPLEEIFSDASPDALDLLKCFLVYPSKKRISAKDVSQHARACTNTNTNAHNHARTCTHICTHHQHIETEMTSSNQATKWAKGTWLYNDKKWWNTIFGTGKIAWLLPGASRERERERDRWGLGGGRGMKSKESICSHHHHNRCQLQQQEPKQRVKFINVKVVLYPKRDLLLN